LSSEMREAQGRREAASDGVAQEVSSTELLKEKLSAAEANLKHETDARVEIGRRNEILNTNVATMKTQISTLKERLAKTNGVIHTSREKLDNLIARNRDLQEKIKQERVREKERREKLVNSLKLTRERLVYTSSLWGAAKKYFTLFRQGLLYEEIEKSDVDLSAETYLCLLPSTVPAAMVLQRKYGGRIICDCVENVEVHKHSLAPNLHPAALEMVNLNAYGALTQVDGIMTVSNSVVETLDGFGRPVRLQPNYRWYEEVKPSGTLRERFNIPTDGTVLVTTGNIVNGFEAVLDAVAELPESIHLVAFIKLSPISYSDEIHGYLENLGLQNRVHLEGFVSYEELPGLLADADAGLITLDPSNPNHSVSLPNRVFDFTTSGLPFVAPPLKEISNYIAEHHCGVTLSDVDSSSWRDGILEVLNNLQELRQSMELARKSVTWNSLEDGLIEFLGNPESVTMLGFRDLTRYQRFLRTTDTLTRRGVKVKAAFFSENPMPLKNSDAEFYHFANRYGVGPGLSRVPDDSE
uniref:glycosyltransferase n=1 Tax=Brevibacterium renqingii TaxID=2776916 RepID=UPI001ADFD252